MNWPVGHQSGHVKRHLGMYCTVNRVCNYVKVSLRKEDDVKVLLPSLLPTLAVEFRRAPC
jgi:hypothetical protein